MTLVRTLTNHGARDSGGLAVRASSPMPTTVVSKTTVGDEIREATAGTLQRFKTKRIESAGDLTDEGVRLLKNAKRTISMETFVKLARAKGEIGPAMWDMICELCNRPTGRIEHESPRMQSLFGALSMMATLPGQEGQFARGLIKLMNAEEAPAPQGVTHEEIVRDSWRIMDRREQRERDIEAEKCGYNPDNAVHDLFLRRA